MTTHEQIIAFLDGELTDQGELAELLHILSVSPEKRQLLVEQARLKRSLQGLGRETVPPAAADAAILAAVGAAPVGVAPEIPLPSPAPWPSGSWLLRGLPLALLLLLVGGLGGWMLRGGDDEPTVIAGSTAVAPVVAAPVLDPSGPLLKDAREEIDRLRAGERRSLSRARDLERQLAALDGRSRRLAEENLLLRRGAEEQSRDQAERSRSNEPSTPASREASVIALRAPQPVVVTPRTDTLSLMTLVRREPLDGGLTDEQPSTEERRWGIGVRTMMRLSLPRLYGLATRQDALTDRELEIAHDPGIELLGLPVRLGLGVGESRFAQVFAISGNGVDTVIEQSPELYYARGWLASELVRWGEWRGSLEIGGGGTQVGPLATVGLDAAWRTSVGVSLRGGAATWMLFSSSGGATAVSTNLAAHIGATYWF